ncbi:MAG: tRNA (N6-isopentenyl adenosine(37)-C2)-methylthiotransferase MiaB [Deltaproteobacteria bacterium]|nr:tRNA (N6-isopentenyl adenosine(37)-C2)-methylthiotransferase MiaB [Candidatus Anaeroferrophillacea bacterium]
MADTTARYAPAGRRPRLYIETYGCQMNVHDSETVRHLFALEGYDETADPRTADLIVINTCSVRAKPEEKVFSALGRRLPLKRRNPALVVAVGGCVAQQWGARLQERWPRLDIVFGTHAIAELPEMVRRVRETGRPQCANSFRERIPSLDIVPRPAAGAVSAFVSIMQGCDNFCAYCIVPYVRGREYSRPSTEIIAECRELLVAGVRELVLLGQNVNSYGMKTSGEIDFPRLLAAIDRLPGLRRLRFVTSHPQDMSPDLIAAFGTLEHLCPQIHLPLQAGSDRVLERMGRGYTAAGYLDIVERLRRARPDIAFSADMIVGFPGETEEDFRATLDMIRRVRYDTVYSFRYSPRPGTRAAAFAGQVPDDECRERLARFQALQDEITRANLEQLVGTTRQVLVLGRDRRGEHWSGRDDANRIVNFSAAKPHPHPHPHPHPGDIVPVQITRALRHSLQGSRVHTGTEAY